MLGRLPEFIDPLRLAQQQRVLKGKISLSCMKRLVPFLARTEGTVEVDLNFGIDELGVHYIHGGFDTVLDLICQRCLEPMTIRLGGPVSLGVVRSEAEGERLPGHYEPLIVGSDAVLLPAIIEDEVMLALPIVPMHASAQCPGWESEAGESEAGAGEPPEGEDGQKSEKVSPFAVLNALKKDRRS
jgi:uncharacterized protein